MTPSLRRGARHLLSGGQHGARSGIVLVYHRVAEVPADPWSLCVSPAHFAEHVAILARYARPIHAGELVRCRGSGMTVNGTVAITFDDGYADLLYAARPLLERASVPATMFITTGAVGSREEFWWDAVERALLHDRPLPPQLRLTVGGAAREWPVAAPSPPESRAGQSRWRAWDAPPSPRHALYLSVWQDVLGMRVAERRRAVADLLAWANMDVSARASHRTLQQQELAALADGGLIEIGAHTVEHPVLAALPPSEQNDEVAGSRASLRRLLGREVDSFSYPFGKPEHVGQDAVRAVRAAGFTAAFVNVDGLVTAETDPFAVPRIFVEDMDGEAFGRLLRRAAGIRIG